MKSKERQLLEDIAAYIRFELDHCTKEEPSKCHARIVATVGHDINGFLAEERCFSPRVSGYAEREEGAK